MFFADLAYALLSLAIIPWLLGLIATHFIIIVVGFFLELLAAFVPTSTSSDSAQGQKPDGAEVKRDRPAVISQFLRSRWPRRLGIGAAIGLSVLLLLTIVLDTFFFDDTAEYLLQSAAKHAEMEMSSAEVSGSLLRGRITLEDVELAREGHETTDFDVEARKLHLDVNLWSLVFRPRRLNVVQADGVDGEVHRLAEADREPKGFRPPSIQIDRLDLSDIDLTYVDHVERTDPLELAIEIEYLETSPLRSDFPWLDFFLYTDTRGTVAGAHFEMSHDIDEDDASHSTWRFEELPVDAAGLFIGGPFAWLKGGRVDIHIDHYRDAPVWEEGHVIESQWSITLRDVGAELGTSPLQAAFAQYVSAQAGDLSFEFSFEIDDLEFSGDASPHTAGLWEAVTGGITERVEERATEGSMDALPDLGGDDDDSDGLLDHFGD